MNFSIDFSDAFPDLPLQKDAPFGALTTFRCGGTAAYMVSPRDASELSRVTAFLKAREISTFVLGRGSNILVSDSGYPGVVISMREHFQDISFPEETILRAGSGALMPDAAREALRHGLSGLEFASGIPGTIGGGLRMNAGAYGSELKDILLRAEVLLPDGTVREYTAGELQLSYRHSIIPEIQGIVLSADFRLEKGDPQRIREKMDDLNGRRREKQPLNLGSAGSTFKRPEGYFAGKLIEDSGLKGFRIGNAAVSEKHAGFVVNLGDAKSADVYRVIRAVQETVFEKFGVRLEPEVILLGDF